MMNEAQQTVINQNILAYSEGFANVQVIHKEVEQISFLYGHTDIPGERRVSQSSVKGHRSFADGNNFPCYYNGELISCEKAEEIQDGVVILDYDYVQSTDLLTIYVCEIVSIRERLGRVVRQTWIDFCLETGDNKPSHIAPWQALNENDKEVDRRIGEAVLKYAVENRISLV